MSRMLLKIHRVIYHEYHCTLRTKLSSLHATSHSWITLSDHCFANHAICTVRRACVCARAVLMEDRFDAVCSR